MDIKFRRAREELLDKNSVDIDKKRSKKEKSDKEKRTITGGEYGKKDTLECFLSGKKYLKKIREEKNLKDIEERTEERKLYCKAFNSKVYNVLLNKKNKLSIKKINKKMLMSLFSKFIHFYDKYQRDLEENLISVDVKSRKTQKDIKKDIVDNFDYIGYLKKKFGDDFYKKIDVYLLENMDPNYSRMIVYTELGNAIKDLGKELKIEINQEDEYIIRRALSSRYDEEGNVCNDKLSII